MFGCSTDDSHAGCRPTVNWAFKTSRKIRSSEDEIAERDLTCRQLDRVLICTLVKLVSKFQSGKNIMPKVISFDDELLR